ncbi:MAG TPA: carboxypeptidase regulatory-like domain-containing protein [Bryobacteraceae bacterium]|nr:carboxypeptidase regulatory-like domain-containing protein [Bryobacteraceae bacterium]
MRIFTAVLLCSVSIALSQQRFETGELKGFTKSPTEHIIERLGEHITVRTIEGTVGSKDMAKPLGGVLVEIRGPGDVEDVRGTSSDRSGRFRFKKVADGDYTIKLTLNGFRSVFGKISVRSSAKGAKPLRVDMLTGV